MIPDPIDLEAAAAYLREGFPFVPRISIVLGSGLGYLADEIIEGTDVDFEELYEFPTPGVESHAGRFIAGLLDPWPVLLQVGRYHAYGGHPMDLWWSHQCVWHHHWVSRSL